MKKKTVLSIAAILFVAVTAIVVYSCQKQTDAPNNTTVTSTSSNSASIVTTGTTSSMLSPENTCTCAPKAPVGCNCIKKIITSGISRSGTINWTSCSGCGGTLPTKSTIIICYDDDCQHVNVQYNNLPPCLQNCYGDPECKTAGIACKKGAYTIQFTGDNGNETFTISGDPHISITCIDALGQQYTCEGDITWN